ncbi:MAG: malto-oligosyltrehalose synthase [Verrucomicrobia bacterium]|nr:malto-oligosyltrehalose synthase [Verrucomicrobiota bacterium]
MPSLRATYRLQFHRHFTFADAQALVPYLARLGVSHVYASPIFRAMPGSEHGYDICDHNEFNPELGSPDDFRRLSDELQRHGLGLILDFVPNHMGIEGARNPWWRDVLENGRSSPYARFFDLEWRPLKRELADKVLLPVLGEQYGRVLESDGFLVDYETDTGRFVVRHGELTLPLDPATILPLLRELRAHLPGEAIELESIMTALSHLPGRNETAPERVAERLREREVIAARLRQFCAQDAPAAALREALLAWHAPTDPTRFDRLDALLSAQAYRLSSWRVAAEEINYRRFFDVNSLAALRMELPEVFQATHRLVLDLVASGRIQGLRIDHLDGLASPAAYLAQLRSACGPDFAIYVEKILGEGETPRHDWPVEGTTGYEFANAVTQVLLDSPGLHEIAGLYAAAVQRDDFAQVAYECRRLIMQTSLASELSGLGSLLNRLSESQRWYRDFTVNSLTAAARELIACFPVYRTYLDPSVPAAAEDVAVIEQALRAARRRNPAGERSVFAFLRDLLLPPDNHPHPVDEELRRAFVQRFQQSTGPITAKGIEDTAFYVFNRLLALNEVGGNPASVGLSVAEFHRQNEARARHFPDSLLAISTHDSKRSGDLRARLTALPEFPGEWAALWREWSAQRRVPQREVGSELAPDQNEIWLLLQTLLGLWPSGERTASAELVERVQAYLLKAMREAKTNTSWLEPDERWEAAVLDYVAESAAWLSSSEPPPSFHPLACRLAEEGAVHGLAQLVLQLTSPGVPDFYQGSELWALSLVDPDNRRPVDYALRDRLLAEVESSDEPAALWRSWPDGRIKLFVLHRLLACRREHEELFARGRYEPVEITGPEADHAMAFRRVSATGSLLVLVPRRSASLGFPPLGECWGETVLNVPPAIWRDVFTGREHEGELRLSQLLASLPCAVLLELR